MSLPAISLVKENYPESKIYLLAGKDNIELTRDIDFIDYFLEYKEDSFSGYKGVLRLTKILKQEAPGCCVVLNPKKEFHLAAFLARIPLRVGYDRKWGFCLNKKIRDNKFMESKPEAEYNIDLVSLLCREVFIPDIKLPVDSGSSLNFLKNDLDLSRKYLVIHPFTSYSAKRIEFDFWSALAGKWGEKFRDNIVLIGEKKELEEGKVLAAKLKIKNLVGKLSLRNLAAFIGHNCSGFIGLDSGPLHLANIIGAPVVGLFKASNPKRWGPYRGKHLVVEAAGVDDFCAAITKVTDFINRSS